MWSQGKSRRNSKFRDPEAGQEKPRTAEGSESGAEGLEKVEMRPPP